LKEYTVRIKHGEVIKLFQLVQDGHFGLNVEARSSFREKPRKQRSLTEVEAYYIAHGLQQRELFLRNVGESYKE
jgi:hypothetical protein